MAPKAKIEHEEGEEHYGDYYRIECGDYVCLVSDNSDIETETRRHDLAVKIGQTMEKFIQEHP